MPGQPAFSKPAFFSWIGYEVHTQDVARFHNSKARTRIISAPARTSKSYSTAAEMAYDAFPHFTRDKNGRFAPIESRLLWCVGPDYPTCKEFDYLYKWLVDDRAKLGFDYKLVKARNAPKNGDMQIIIEWGRSPDGELHRTIVKGMSATHERALQGEEVYHSVMSEAAEQPASILTKYLATRSHRLTLPTTPKPGASWIKELIDLGEADPTLGIEHFHYAIDFDSRSCPNPTFDWKRFEQERRRAIARSPTGQPEDDPFFAEQFLGMWVYYTGRVLPLFRREASVPGKMSHLFDDFPQDLPKWRKFVSLDYGYDHPSAAIFWAVAPDGTLFICDELLESQIAPEKFVDAIKRKVSDELGWSVDYYVGDPSRPEVEAIMRDLGLPVYRVANKNTLRDRAAGTLLLIQYLSNDPQLGRPKLFVHRACRNIVHEWTTLRRKEDYTGDEFGKAAFAKGCRDDLFDAARYGLMTRVDPYSPKGSEHWVHQFERERRRAAQQSNFYAPAYTEAIGAVPRVTGRAA